MYVKENNIIGHNTHQSKAAVAVAVAGMYSIAEQGLPHSPRALVFRDAVLGYPNMTFRAVHTSLQLTTNNAQACLLRLSPAVSFWRLKSACLG